MVKTLLIKSKYSLLILLIGLPAVMMSCGDSSDTAASGQTSEVGCSISESGSQALQYVNFDPQTSTTTDVDEALAFSYAWTCAGEERTLTGNGVPNHAVTNGEFASKISVQTVSFTATLNPAKASTATNVKEPGYAVNSIKFDPATAGTCPDAAVAVNDCDPGAGSDTWQMVALPGDSSPWQFGFGVDDSNAHVQPGGIYHYHGIPEALLEKLNTASATTPTLVGWAVDGFPIYAPPTDVASRASSPTSSFSVLATPSTGRPDVANFVMGHFEQDWEYVEGSGDLDECNGMTGATAEFPEGIYHYWMTTAYPFIQRCVKGTAATGVGGPGGGGPGGGGPPPDGGGPPPE